ncbi:MAG TPA: DNA polymerase ligase N-terminal domain-containing protein [Polyangiaceae bacterium]
MADRLGRYRDKRDPAATSEPGVAGHGETSARGSSKSPRFVIQKHDASSLHYDFRLEVEGTLRSWAVPKGPSADPREKRLAIEVEDHPLEYADFEGMIGRGNYGAGAVIVWDAGTYRNLDEERSMAAAIEAGHVKVWLEGEKLKGGWTLQRTRGGEKPQWLMIKRRDEGADARRNPESTEPESVLTGRTVEQVAAEEGGDRAPVSSVEKAGDEA